MADMNIFSSRPIERISDVATVKPAGDDKKHGSNPGTFEQMLNSHKNNGGNARKDSHNSAKPRSSGSSGSTDRDSDRPMNYGFINYYNGKAQAAYFCMTESLMDNKA
ncbi:MAG: hypothetical protein MRZ64_11490 [[Bacteroides] pectinophilus]|nr:hypothetical protein [[Bacteroides] pectinophilus]